MGVTAHPLFEDKFHAHGATFVLEDDVPLASMRILESAQVRSASDIAPADQVNLYAIQMQAGVLFPPVVLWGDIIIDGNTRIHAARKVGRVGLPAYRLTCRNEAHARDIAAALNNTNGRRLAPLESRRAAVSMLDRGLTDAFIARELGVEATKVRRWRKEESAREHAERLGLGEELAEISATNRAILADVSHDAPFRALVETFTERTVPSAQVKETVDAVRSAASDDAAVREVEERATAWPLRGEGLPAHRSSHRVTAREAYRAIGALLAHDAAYWVDLTVSDEALPRWEKVLGLASQVVEDYRRHLQVAS